MPTLRRFSGTSQRGDFHEALTLAIAAAKDGLHTDLVRWTLSRVSGENGGFVLQDDLTVQIQAAGPARSSVRAKRPTPRRKAS